jgi:hypothetical protein
MNPLNNCLVPENQPLYHALLDKADSYSLPQDKYKVAAYHKVAQNVLICDSNLYKDITVIPGVGHGIRHFINQFIHPSLTPVIEPEVDNYEFVTILPEDNHITKAIKNVCNEKNVPYTSQLVQEFHTWYELLFDIKHYFHFRYTTYNNTTRTRVPKPIHIVASIWARHDSCTLNTYYRQRTIKRNIRKLFAAHNLPLDEPARIAQYTLWLQSKIGSDCVPAAEYAYIRQWFKTITTTITTLN